MEKLSKERISKKVNESKKDRNHYGFIAFLSAILVVSSWGINVIVSLFFLACLIYECNKYLKMDKEYKKWKNDFKS